MPDILRFYQIPPFIFFFTFPLRIKDWYTFTVFWEKDRRSVFFLQQILLILKILAPATIFHSKITSLSTFPECSSNHPSPPSSTPPLPSLPQTLLLHQFFIPRLNGIFYIVRFIVWRRKFFAHFPDSELSAETRKICHNSINIIFFENPLRQRVWYVSRNNFNKKSVLFILFKRLTNLQFNLSTHSLDLTTLDFLQEICWQ